MMNTMHTAVAGEELQRRVAQFVSHASTEITTNDAGLLPELVTLLPPKAAIYVAHIPKATLDDVISVAIKVQDAGLRASPHIIARRLESESALRSALRRLRDHGIDQVLLVAGDREQPLGPFSSTLDVFDSGVFADAGITQIGVAGHPEGHPAVETAVLFEALQRKQAFADRTGLKVHITTQFGFNAPAVGDWHRQLVERGVRLPVHAGIAGPTPMTRLMKYAMQCGIGASLQAMMKNPKLLGSLTRGNAAADGMLADLVRQGASSDAQTGIVKPHFFCFGGVLATVKWMRAVVNGEHQIDA